jgi:hypothetical protein
VGRRRRTRAEGRGAEGRTRGGAGCGGRAEARGGEGAEVDGQRRTDGIVLLSLFLVVEIYQRCLERLVRALAWYAAITVRTSLEANL